MNRAFLGIFLAAHHLWLIDDPRGVRFYAQDAYLQDAYLRGANLRGADLRGAYLQDANLRGAYLQDADLRGANLQCADLRGANLQCAYLQCAYLQDADLRGANLQCADLRGANLRGANRIIGPQRSDGYQFTYCLVENKVHAGCRSLTFAEYEAHIAAEYEGTAKAGETRAILQCLRILAELRQKEIGQ